MVLSSIQYILPLSQIKKKKISAENNLPVICILTKPDDFSVKFYNIRGKLVNIKTRPTFYNTVYFNQSFQLFLNKLIPQGIVKGEKLFT